MGQFQDLENGKFVESVGVAASTIRVKVIGDVATTGSSLSFNDEDTSDSTYEYYGFSSGGNAWKIVRITKDTGATRKAEGGSDYVTAWLTRETQTYTY